MKCSRCGKEAELKDGFCPECYKEVVRKKYAKFNKKVKGDPNYVLNQLERNEKVIAKLKTSSLIYSAIIVIFAISVLLFPKTIIEFFVLHNNYYFPILVANILICFIGIYSTIYFASRELYLTNKRIIGKWGLFKLKFLNAPLDKIESIDTFKIRAIEIDIYGDSYVFDFISNPEEFKLATVNQVKNLIDSTNDEHVLMSFTHSLNDKLKEYQLRQEHPDMTYCRCCGEMISKESKFCVHCGQPLPENESQADWVLRLFCFLLPPLGFLAFLVNVGEHHKLANQCLLTSIFGLFIILTGYLSIASILSVI